jgi:NCS1 family nucleobase:cation symporter-1
MTEPTAVETGGTPVATSGTPGEVKADHDPRLTILGALTFMIATVGINIVANFVSPAFDFSNVNPQKISWRMGGMIAAVGSVLITPWNLYSSPEVIHYTQDTLGAFIGPLYGVLIADYYLVKKRRIDVDSMYTLKPDGRYYFAKGYNPIAIGVTAVGAIAAMAVVLLGSSDAAAYSWFIGAGIAFVLHRALSRKQGEPAVPEQAGAAPQS